jgi:hypothetical protein
MGPYRGICFHIMAMGFGVYELNAQRWNPSSSINVGISATRLLLVICDQNYMANIEDDGVGFYTLNFSISYIDNALLISRHSQSELAI